MQVLELPQGSVARIVIVVTPRPRVTICPGVKRPGTVLVEILISIRFWLAQASLTVGVGKVYLRVHTPGSVPTVTLGGHVSVGGVLSTTRISCTCVRVAPVHQSITCHRRWILYEPLHIGIVVSLLPTTYWQVC